MSISRKDISINLCRKVDYFLLERENEWVKSALSGCQECIMYYGTNLRRRYNRHFEGFELGRDWYSIEATNHDVKLNTINRWRFNISL